MRRGAGWGRLAPIQFSIRREPLHAVAQRSYHECDLATALTENELSDETVRFLLVSDRVMCLLATPLPRNGVVFFSPPAQCCATTLK